MKQLYFLKNTDLGMERHNIGNVALWNGDIKQWEEKIKALPMVTETLPPSYFPIIPTGPMMYIEINNWMIFSKYRRNLSLSVYACQRRFF